MGAMPPRPSPRAGREPGPAVGGRRGPVRVIKSSQVITDSWERLDAPALPLPVGDLILPFAFWQAHRDALAGRAGKIAVCLNGDDALEDFADFLPLFEMIALEFPNFKDGRSYSHARLLRERFGFRGELRAVGDVLRDQLFFMGRCGIDAFQVREDKDAEDALKGLSGFTVKYQTAADEAPPIYITRSEKKGRP